MLKRLSVEELKRLADSERIKALRATLRSWVNLLILAEDGPHCCFCVRLFQWEREKGRASCRYAWASPRLREKSELLSVQWLKLAIASAVSTLHLFNALTSP
jgi:hypothetical protein